MGFDGVYAHFSCDGCGRRHNAALPARAAGTTCLGDEAGREIASRGWARQGASAYLCPDCFKDIQGRLVAVEGEDGNEVTVELARGSAEDGIGMLFHEGVAAVVRDGQVVRRVRDVGSEWRDRAGQELWQLCRRGEHRPGYEHEWVDVTGYVLISVPSRGPGAWVGIDVADGEEVAAGYAAEHGPGRYLLTRILDDSVIRELVVPRRQPRG